jgi:vitamin B12 transporter
VTPLTLSAGLRYDDHETFGNDTSAQAALAWAVAPSTLVRTSYGEGFKAPTLFHLYSEFGTITLDPEESKDWDVGVEQRLFGDALSVSASYFERETSNMIDFVSCFRVVSARCSAQPNGYYENIAATRADGYELSLTARFGPRILVTANYTGLDARNDTRGTANFGRELPRRPLDAAAVEFSYEWPVPLTTSLAAQYVGRTFDNVGNTLVVEEYTLVDVRVAYRWSESMEIYGRVENLFDEEYQTTRRYGTLGRSAYLGLRTTF